MEHLLYVWLHLMFLVVKNSIISSWRSHHMASLLPGQAFDI